MWLALPRPSGNPTTRLVPTSRMMSSAISSGSENNFGIEYDPGVTEPADARNRPSSLSEAIADSKPIFVCDEPATAKHCFDVLMSRGGLSVATATPKQVDVSGAVGGGGRALGRGLGGFGGRWVGVAPRVGTL